MNEREKGQKSVSDGLNERALDAQSDAPDSAVGKEGEVRARLRSMIMEWPGLQDGDEADVEALNMFLLFQGCHLARFDQALEKNLRTLTEAGQLPERLPGEIYSIEYVLAVSQAYDAACAEVGWDPMVQLEFIGRARK